MADADKALTIQIILDLLGAGKAEEAKLKLAELKNTSADLAKEMGVITVSGADVEKILGKETTATGELDIKKRELVESIRSLSHEYPILAEAARAAFNPMTAVAFGLAEAINMAMEKYKALTQAFGGTELPDFTDDIQKISAVGTAYDGLTTSINNANAALDSATGIYERQATAINAIAKGITAATTAQKNKAIADLDLQRATGQITPGEYNVKKSIIEQGYNDQTTQDEISQRNAELANKKQEAANATAAAQKTAQAAAGVKLPESDDAVQAQIDAQKELAKNLREQAKAARAEAAHATDIAHIEEGGQGLGGLRDVPAAIAFQLKYGSFTKPEDIAKINNDTARNAEENAAAAEAEAARIEAQKKHRDELRKQAEDAAAQATKLNRELEGEDDPRKPGSTAWQNSQARANQKTNDHTAEENRFAQDVTQFNADAATLKKIGNNTDPGSISAARAAMKDMMALVTDAVSVMQALAVDHQNIAALQRQVRAMQATLSGQGGQIRNMPGQGY